MPLTHVVESQQFTVPLLQELFERSRRMEKVVARGGTRDYGDRIMATLFYEPSTRTRLSFEAAMHRLGGGVLSTEQARAFSSEVVGEQLEDTIRIIGGIADVIVLRHTDQDGAARAAAVSPVPVVNAGDGNGGQHPTQALLDLYTIWRERGSLDGLSIAMVGELDRGRTVRSLAYLLSKYERVKIYFVSPPEVQMQPDILEHLDRHGAWHEQQPDLAKVVDEVDVVYLTRIKPDRVRERASLSRYTADVATVQRMKKDAMILHPLPRTVELDPAVDRDPRARYFQQATNGLFVRMALLTLLFDEP
jgi:aspartate carbamoyltransferase catalytic subunit